MTSYQKLKKERDQLRADIITLVENPVSFKSKEITSRYRMYILAQESALYGEYKKIGDGLFDLMSKKQQIVNKILSNQENKAHDNN